MERTNGHDKLCYNTRAKSDAQSCFSYHRPKEVSRGLLLHSRSRCVRSTTDSCFLGDGSKSAETNDIVETGGFTRAICGNHSSVSTWVPCWNSYRTATSSAAMPHGQTPQNRTTPSPVFVQANRLSIAVCASAIELVQWVVLAPDFISWRTRRLSHIPYERKAFSKRHVVCRGHCELRSHCCTLVA